MLPSNRGDDTEVCPYDASHVIQKKSFQKHIIKCRENHKTSKKAVCRFDKTHIVPQPELHHHILTCPSRSVLDRELQLRASCGQAFTGAVEGPEIISHIKELDEDWGSGPPVETNALFNKQLNNNSEEEDPKPYIPPGANFIVKKHKDSDHAKSLPQSKESQVSSESKVEPESVIFHYSKNSVAKLGNLENNIERLRGAGRGVLSSQSQPKFSSLGRGISRSDGPQLKTSTGLLQLQNGQCQRTSLGFVSSDQIHPELPSGFVLPELISLGTLPDQNLVLKVPPGFTSMTESKEKEFRQFQEKELKSLLERQDEEQKLMDKRHEQEREELTQRLNLVKDLILKK